MTYNEIIKFIEYAINSAKGEDGFKEIYWEKLEYILALINRQKAEIDGLQRIVSLSIDTQNEFSDTITEQKAEIERLNIELQSIRSAANSYKMHYEKAQIEIDRLQKNIDGLNIFTTNHIKVIRLQAMKEFAEELKRKATVVHKTHIGKHWYEIDDDEIDNIIKEKIKEGVD